MHFIIKHIKTNIGIILFLIFSIFITTHTYSEISAEDVIKTRKALFSKNYNTAFTRHIGSANTLLYDLSVLKSKQYLDEISTREGQLMHDILIYLILHNKGMLELRNLANLKARFFKMTVQILKVT